MNWELICAILCVVGQIAVCLSKAKRHFLIVMPIVNIIALIVFTAMAVHQYNQIITSLPLGDYLLIHVISLVISFIVVIGLLVFLWKPVKKARTK